MGSSLCTGNRNSAVHSSPSHNEESDSNGDNSKNDDATSNEKGKGKIYMRILLIESFGGGFLLI